MFVEGNLRILHLLVVLWGLGVVTVAIIDKRRLYCNDLYVVWLQLVFSTGTYLTRILVNDE